ncbi:MAG TPA: DinB family protein [Candidatus Limnocylindrales bacterium]|nr:DinB family protein [Candidatus Limnocylindrales bacterium]
MISPPPGLVDTYAGWARHQRELIELLGGLTDAQLALRPASEPQHWAIWQLASNMVGGRAYWFHSVLGEGQPAIRDMFRVTQTTVPDLRLTDAGWEDDENHPRGSAELVHAFETTWQLVQDCLGRWTAEDLEEVVAAKAGAYPTVKRGWVVWHLIEHELQHGTEIALILRQHGLPTIEL